MMFTFLENALNVGIFTHAPVPNSKFQADFSEICFPQQQKEVETTLISFIKI